VSTDSAEDDSDPEDDVTVAGEALDALPEVDLEWLCDEETDCEELTVFDPRAESPETTWLSVDAHAAVSLEEAQ
jgi:hypothetical protein